MSLSTTILAMLAAGCSAEQIGAVAQADEAARMRTEEAKREARREGNRVRQAARRGRNGAEMDKVRIVGNAVTDNADGVIGSASHAVTSRDEPLHSVTGVTGVSLEVSPKDNNQTPFLDPSPNCDTGARQNSLTGKELVAKADEFYAIYPKKVDPNDAKSRFIRLVKSGVDPDLIIAAAKRFAEAHRLAATDKQFIRAPAVWLNKGGYLSEDLPQPRAQGPPNGRGPPPSRRPPTALSTFQRIANGTYPLENHDIFADEAPAHTGPTIEGRADEDGERR